MKRFKKFIPTKDKIINNKNLVYLKKYMNAHHLWEFSSKTTTLGVMIGLFWAMMPMPFQMVPAAILAIVFRANIIVAISMVWVSNPITMGPIIYFCFIFGCFVTGYDNIFTSDNFTLNFILEKINEIFLPLITGCIIVGIISSLFGGFITYIVWKIALKNKKNKNILNNKR